VETYRDGLDAGVESRVFVQGAAPGGFSVTARLDTRKRYDDPLLKQPDPEKQYPIYGDASRCATPRPRGAVITCRSIATSRTCATATCARPSTAANS
jgi:hypothetical protein